MQPLPLVWVTGTVAGVYQDDPDHENEDAILVVPESPDVWQQATLAPNTPPQRALLSVVIDGMSSGGRGKDAAREATNAIRLTWNRQTDYEVQQNPIAVIRTLMEAAYKAVVNVLNKQTGGAACLISIVHGDRLTFGHVGDCRLYHARRAGGLTCITTDQTAIERTPEGQQLQERVRAASLDALTASDQQKYAWYENALTRFLGREDLSRIPMDEWIEVGQLTLASQDVVLIVSDGVLKQTHLDNQPWSLDDVTQARTDQWLADMVGQPQDRDDISYCVIGVTGTPEVANDQPLIPYTPVYVDVLGERQPVQPEPPVAPRRQTTEPLPGANMIAPQTELLSTAKATARIEALPEVGQSSDQPEADSTLPEIPAESRPHLPAASAQIIREKPAAHHELLPHTPARPRPYLWFKTATWLVREPRPGQSAHDQQAADRFDVYDTASGTGVASRLPVQDSSMPANSSYASNMAERGPAAGPGTLPLNWPDDPSLSSLNTAPKDPHATRVDDGSSQQNPSRMPGAIDTRNLGAVPTTRETVQPPTMGSMDWSGRSIAQPQSSEEEEPYPTYFYHDPKTSPGQANALPAQSPDSRTNAQGMHGVTRSDDAMHRPSSDGSVDAKQPGTPHYDDLQPQAAKATKKRNFRQERPAKETQSPPLPQPSGTQGTTHDRFNPSSTTSPSPVVTGNRLQRLASSRNTKDPILLNLSSFFRHQMQGKINFLLICLLFLLVIVLSVILLVPLI